MIGVGKMGGAILRGALKFGAAKADSVWVNDVVPERAEAAAAELGVRVAASKAELLEHADWVLYAAHPSNLDEALADLSESGWRDGSHKNPHWILSIAAGVSTRRLEAGLPEGSPAARAMPNIAAAVGEAMTCVCGGRHAVKKHLDASERLLACVGKTLRVEERLMHAVTGLSGSGPGFAMAVLEALADAGVEAGLPFDQSLLLARQTLLGAAALAAESEEHPAVWKSRVASPGGTTAAGLAALERGGARSALRDAVKAAAARSKELENE